MAKILIIYGTEEGQARKIAEFIDIELKTKGNITEIFDAKNVPPNLNPQDFDGVIAGASVHMSGYPPAFKKWAVKWAPILRHKPAAFFSVCLGILQQEPRVQEEEKRIVREFFSEAQWHPALWTIFPGALRYSKYNWFVKRIMKYMAKEAGVFTDTSHDYEFTNWEKVREFTHSAVTAFEGAHAKI